MRNSQRLIFPQDQDSNCHQMKSSKVNWKHLFRFSKHCGVLSKLLLLLLSVSMHFRASQFGKYEDMFVIFTIPPLTLLQGS